MDNVKPNMYRIKQNVRQMVDMKAPESDIDTYRFMRWAEPRELGILAQYDQTRYEDIDKRALDTHPVVKFWTEITPYLLQMNKSYQGVFSNNAY